MDQSNLQLRKLNPGGILQRRRNPVLSAWNTFRAQDGDVALAKPGQQESINLTFKMEFLNLTFSPQDPLHCLLSGMQATFISALPPKQPFWTKRVLRKCFLEGRMNE